MADKRKQDIFCLLSLTYQNVGYLVSSQRWSPIKGILLSFILGFPGINGRILDDGNYAKESKGSNFHQEISFSKVLLIVDVGKLLSM